MRRSTSGCVRWTKGCNQEMEAETMIGACCDESVSRFCLDRKDSGLKGGRKKLVLFHRVGEVARKAFQLPQGELR